MMFSPLNLKAIITILIAGEPIRPFINSLEMSLNSIATNHLSQFLAAIFFFHGSEFVLAVAFHGRSNVSVSSLLISKQYIVAMACALVEYLVEYSLFPELKNNWSVSTFGLLMVLCGEVIRKAAIITARRSFTHNIRIYYEDSHVLITHGIYSFMRHPGYCGFFIWAIGTQVMLCNPICIFAFAAVIWRFFSRRILYPCGKHLVWWLLYWAYFMCFVCQCLVTQFLSYITFLELEKFLHRGNLPAIRGLNGWDSIRKGCLEFREADLRLSPYSVHGQLVDSPYLRIFLGIEVPSSRDQI